MLVAVWPGDGGGEGVIMYSGEEPPEATTVTASDHCCIYALLWWLKIVIFLLYFIKVEIDMINKTGGFGSLKGWIQIRMKTFMTPGSGSEPKYFTVT